MTSINKAIMDHLEDILTVALIDAPRAENASDPSIAGVVKQGPLQGEPAPDTARISVTLHENDPNNIDDKSWNDRIVGVEAPRTVTIARRLWLRGRCLLVDTQETLDEARDICSTVKRRTEQALLREEWTGVAADDGEFVSRGAISSEMRTRMRQGGGPPDSYDFHFDIIFDIWTTKGVL